MPCGAIVFPRVLACCDWVWQRTMAIKERVVMANHNDPWVIFFLSSSTISSVLIRQNRNYANSASFSLRYSPASNLLLMDLKAAMVSFTSSSE